MANAYFNGKTLDDVLRRVIEEVITCAQLIRPSKGGAEGALEITGVLLEISDPRARLSRTETRGRIFSGLGELCWYLSGSNSASFISYYINEYEKLAENGEIFGGYGPRLRNWKGVNQLSNIIEILRSKRDSRQAVIQLFDALDLKERHEDVPCTCTLQFMLRQGRLQLFANMRSNDVHWGLPHDVFCFTMLQEIVARSIPAELGSYKHAVGSLHLYVRDKGAAKRFLKEGWQSTKAVMPSMPAGDPWPSIEALLEAESAIRAKGSLDEVRFSSLDAYWADLIRLLQVFAAQTKEHRDLAAIKETRGKMSSSVYHAFLDRIIRKLEVQAH